MALVYLVGIAGLAILAGFIDPRDVRYAPETSWAEVHLVRSADIIVAIAIATLSGMIVSVVIDKLRRRPADLRFYPVRRRALACVRNVWPRRVLVAGLVVLLGVLVIASVHPRPPGSSSEVVILSMLWIWFAVWLSETLVPPRRPTAVAALALGLSVLLLGCCPSVRPMPGGQSADGTALPVRSVSDLIHMVGYAIDSRIVEQIPQWATETTETRHFVYHYSKGDHPIAASLDAQERHYAFFKKVFGVDLPQKINFVKYPDRNSFAEAWPGAGGIGGRGHVHSRHWFHPHEAVHCYLRSRSLFLHEGIAEAFGTTFYYFWGDIAEQPIEVDQASLRKTMDKCLGLDETDRRIAGNFVRWLYHRYGPAKLVAVLHEAYVEGGRTRDVLVRIYGMSFTKLVSRWQQDQQWLREQPPPEGFFAHPPWDKEVKGSD